MCLDKPPLACHYLHQLHQVARAVPLALAHPDGHVQAAMNSCGYGMEIAEFPGFVCVVCNIFLIFFDTPGMLVHEFQVIQNFLYVCQSVSCLTPLLTLYKYGDISSS